MFLYNIRTLLITLSFLPLTHLSAAALPEITDSDDDAPIASPELNQTGKYRHLTYEYTGPVKFSSNGKFVIITLHGIPFSLEFSALTKQELEDLFPTPFRNTTNNERRK